MSSPPYTSGSSEVAWEGSLDPSIVTRLVRGGWWFVLMAKPSWAKAEVRIPPSGQIRQSQVITTFGPGAMMDLVDQAVLVGGLDFWSYDKQKGVPVIREPRLRDALAERFKAAGRSLSLDEAFREPPRCDDRQPLHYAGIQVLEMPHWFVCQNPECRSLVKSDGLELKGGRYFHFCESRKKSETVPVRFVVACEKGHVDDFPWIHFAHRNVERRCVAPSLRLREGVTGDFSEILVECACGARERLSAAMARESMPRCTGARPWLGEMGGEQCTARMRLLVRTASNSYFAQVVSALSFPEKGRELEAAVRSVWDVLKSGTPETLPVFRTIDKVKVALAAYADRQVLEAIQAIQRGTPVAREPLRTAEFKQFLEQPPEAPGDLPRRDDVFFARSVVPEGGLPARLSRLFLARKLREVRVQVGFTRIEPVTPDLEGEFDLGVESAALGLTTDWLPATEIHGEGVLLVLDEDAVREWESRAPVNERARALLAGHDAWAATLSTPPGFPGARFYMLHSLAHLLIGAISLECGYSASSIRERIYCAPAGAPTPMAAILLSTGTSGTDGTLGGLVEQGRRIRSHLRKAFELGSLCSNDPVCASHSPKDDPAERFLEGAACHGCLFIAECSCERFNRYLDRALVLPTIGHDPGLAFFKDRP